MSAAHLPATSISRPVPTGPASPSSRAALRLLQALQRPGSLARPDPADATRIFVASHEGGVSLGRGAHDAATLRDLHRRDLVEAPAPGRFVISAAGRAHLRRGGRCDFGAQHQEREEAEIAGRHGRDRVTVNAQESPLDWLRRRRGADGEPLIDAAAYGAGERLRRDLTQAGMMPSITARWEGAIGSGGPALRDPAGATDAMIAARQRVRRVMEALGPAFADLLIDLCGFLKGLETIERERRWPARSAKIVVRLALDQLARHYGLAPVATGPTASRGIRAWAEEPEPVR